MTAVGRISSLVFLVAVATLILIVTLRPDLQHVGAVHVVDWLGLMIYLSAPVAWISAIVHWVRRFPRAGPRASRGFMVVLGFVPGAIVYWLWGVRRLGPGPAGAEDSGEG